MDGAYCEQRLVNTHFHPVAQPASEYCVISELLMRELALTEVKSLFQIMSGWEYGLRLNESRLGTGLQDMLKQQGC